MYDQSFCKKTLELVLQKRDFKGIPAATQNLYREDLLTEAVTSAASKFGSRISLLGKFPLKGKMVFDFPKLADELVARKLRDNIRHAREITFRGRSQIVSNLHLLLEEGVPYRVYRLDVASFYESFKKSDVLALISELPRLSPQSKILLRQLLESHSAMGGAGVPRGLSLSATLSDLMMKDFDTEMEFSNEVFYYSRYVDDIVLMTSGREDPSVFIRSLKRALPSGLRLNSTKTQVVQAIARVKPIKASEESVNLFKFDYLGYAFIVNEPVKSQKQKDGDLHRSVTVDVASKKIQRIKTRIVRSFLDFSNTGNWPLLRDRIKFLSQNFSVYNPKAGGKKLAGIFHSYPLVSEEAQGLQRLNAFLRNAILSNNGRVFSKSALKLNGKYKRELLAQCFVRGHKERTFVHFSAMRISEIQRCWTN